MSKIDLQYIGTKESLTKLLAIKDLALTDLVDHLRIVISNDISLAQAYVDKYDNKYDRLEGTDVSELKQELEIIDENLKRLESLK